MFEYKFDELYNPTLTALHKLGGSGSIEEMEREVTTIMNLTEEEANDIHRGNVTKLKYRLAWARNYLKHYGVVENSSRGVWALTPAGTKTNEVDKADVNKFVQKLGTNSSGTSETEQDASEDENEILGWQEATIEILKSIEPAQFERLCQRMLRESGFTNVEVTGRSGDGGIDGKGVVRLGGLLSFHVVFQCKRYQGSVTPSEIRDFRGAMIGRADKGLFITTGNFTKEAMREAQRDGAPPIDLIDGIQLAEKLKDLRLGVETYTEEKVRPNRSWFENI